MNQNRFCTVRQRITSVLEGFSYDYIRGFYGLDSNPRRSMAGTPRTVTIYNEVPYRIRKIQRWLRMMRVPQRLNTALVRMFKEALRMSTVLLRFDVDCVWKRHQHTARHKYCDSILYILSVKRKLARCSLCRWFRNCPRPDNQVMWDITLQVTE